MIFVIGIIVLGVAAFIMYNIRALRRTIGSKRFGKALYELYGASDSKPTTDYDLFRMIGPKAYEMSYEVRQTNYDQDIPFRTFIRLNKKAERQVCLFVFMFAPRAMKWIPKMIVFVRSTTKP
jgi:hypothetical protein